jgi:hypothetical protein
MQPSAHAAAATAVWHVRTNFKTHTEKPQQSSEQLKMSSAAASVRQGNSHSSGQHSDEATDKVTQQHKSSEKDKEKGVMNNSSDDKDGNVEGGGGDGHKQNENRAQQNQADASVALTSVAGADVYATALTQSAQHSQQPHAHNAKHTRAHGHVVKDGKEHGHGGGGGACFASDSIVIDERKGEVTMSRLRVGDKVCHLSTPHLLVQILTADNIFSPVTMFLHRDAHRAHRFIRVHTACNRTLTLSDRHLLPIIKCGAHRNVDVTTLMHMNCVFAYRARAGECVLVSADNNRSTHAA